MRTFHLIETGASTLTLFTAASPSMLLPMQFRTICKYCPYLLHSHSCGDVLDVPWIPSLEQIKFFELDRVELIFLKWEDHNNNKTCFPAPCHRGLSIKHSALLYRGCCVVLRFRGQLNWKRSVECKEQALPLRHRNVCLSLSFPSHCSSTLTSPALPGGKSSVVSPHQEETFRFFKPPFCIRMPLVSMQRRTRIHKGILQLSLSPPLSLSSLYSRCASVVV